MANSRFNDDLNAAKRGVARWAKDPLGIDLVHDAYHKIVNDHWSDKHVDNPKPAAKAPDYYSDPNITSRPASTPNPKKSAGDGKINDIARMASEFVRSHPRPSTPPPDISAPVSQPATPKPLSDWSSEELASGFARNKRIADASENSQVDYSGIIRGQTGRDSSDVILSEVQRRSNKLRAEAEKNRNQ